MAESYPQTRSEHKRGLRAIGSVAAAVSPQVSLDLEADPVGGLLNYPELIPEALAIVSVAAPLIPGCGLFARRWGNVEQRTAHLIRRVGVRRGGERDARRGSPSSGKSTGSRNGKCCEETTMLDLEVESKLG